MLNRTVLVGRLTRDPELRRTSSQMAVVSFTVAVDDSRKGPNGEKQTLFMSCSMFGNRAENVAKYTRKGSLIAVEGRLSQRKYNRKADGVQVTVIELIADNVEFLDPKGANASSGAPTGDFSQVGGNDFVGDEGAATDTMDVLDDDLPF